MSSGKRKTKVSLWKRANTIEYGFIQFLQTTQNLEKMSEKKLTNAVYTPALNVCVANRSPKISKASFLALWWVSDKDVTEIYRDPLHFETYRRHNTKSVR